MRRGLDRLARRRKLTRGQTPPALDRSASSVLPKPSSTFNDGPSIDTLAPRPLSTSFHPHDDLADLWEEAIEQFKAVAGVDLTDKDAELHRRLEGCTDSPGVVTVLNETLEKFKAYRDPAPDSSGAKLRRVLRRTVRTVLRAGVVDASGEASAAMAIPGGKAIFVAMGVLLQATQGVSDRFDAVILLLQKFEAYMTRLDVRLQAPLVQATRSHTVKILIEMLGAFAIAIDMMRRHRIKHFISVLTGGGQDVSGALQRLETLQAEDTRLSLAELHLGVHSLSLSVHTEAARAKADVVQRIERATSEVTTRISADLQASKIFELSHKLDDFTASWAEWKRDSLAKTNTTSGSPPASISGLIGKLLEAFRDLPPSEQTVMRDAVAIIYSLAAYAAGGNSDTAWYAAILNPVAFVSAFLPMAAAYIGLYICWRQMRALQSPTVPPSPNELRLNTVVLIDVLGAHLVLSLDRCSSWADIHSLLLSHFADKDGVEYVRSHAYVIMDTAGQSEIVSPKLWALTVRAGMTLEMGIVVRQPSNLLRCPWCESVAQGASDSEDDVLKCRGCKRYFRASTAIPTKPDESYEQLSERRGEDASSVPTSHESSAGAEVADPDLDTIPDDGQVRRSVNTMALYRRIVVELLDHDAQSESAETQEPSQEPSNSVDYRNILLALVNNIGQPLQRQLLAQLRAKLPSTPQQELLALAHETRLLISELKNGSENGFHDDSTSTKEYKMQLHQAKLSLLTDFEHSFQVEVERRGVLLGSTVGSSAARRG
ncbi:unnamed protein product [Peniophora sp. CBMAI 1063]|nr:unnamed protein product [Peniophora sp. CBMAI 1063]